MGAARNRKEAIVALKASGPRPQEPQLFDTFIGIAQRHGWSEGYAAPESPALREEIKVAAALTLRAGPEAVARLGKETSRYADYGYLAGLADFVFGAITLLQMQ